MIEKERSANNPRVKVNVGQPNQRVYTKVTKNIKQKEEKIETKIKKQDKESIIKNVYETKKLEDAQENNNYVKPTSTRQSVEVDKIAELLKSPSHIPTKETATNEKRKENIEKIVEDIQKVETPKQETPKIQKDTLKEKKIQPIKKEKKEEENTLSQNNNVSESNNENKPKGNVLNFILIIAVIIMGFFTYKNSSNKTSNLEFKDLSQKIQNQYILKSELPQSINGQLKFNNLPNKIQEQYVLKNKIVKSQKHTNMLIKKSRLLADKNKLLKKQVEQLKLENMNAIKITKSQNKNRDLLKENALLKKEQSSYSNKIVSYKIASKKDKKHITALLSKEKKLTKEISSLKKLQSQTNTPLNSETKISKTKLPSPENLYYDIVQREVFPATKSTSTDYKLVKCYDLEPGVFYLSQTCKKEITDFLKNNTKAKRFEVIGVVDQKDFTTFTTQDPTSESAQELQKYSNIGLARYRVLETSWLISEVLGKDIILTPVNYTITSKKNNRGSIIRAYYK